MKVSRPDIDCTEISRYDGRLYPTVNIEKLSNLLGYTELIPPQIALMNAFLTPKYRFIVGCMSRRTGKTIVSNIIATMVSLVPNANILVICPDYSLANISWDLQLKNIGILGISTKKQNVRDREIVTETGAMIKLASAERADSAVGRSYDLILFDEAAIHEGGKEVFDIALRPTLDKLTSKCIFISTPRGDNYFKEFYDRGYSDDFPSWISIHSTWKDNPRANPLDIEEAKRGMPAAIFQQEYEATFTVFEGQAFGSFREDNILCEGDYNIDTFDEFVIGLDIGFRDPTACVVVGLKHEDSKGTIAVVVDAWEIAHQSTAEIAEKLRHTMGLYDVECIYIDSAAAQTRYDLAEIYDITCINADKAVVDGVAFINTLFQQQRLFIVESCELVIITSRNLTWDKKSKLEKLLHNKFIHVADALRYGIYSHRLEFDLA